MNRIIIFVVGCLLMYNMAFAQPSIYPGDLNWQLKWEDNFSFLNTDIWEVRNNHDSWGFPCVNLDSNASIDNNTLVLRTKKQDYCCPQNTYFCQWQNKNEECYQYTGALVTNKPAYNTKYGYMEAKIKMTYRKGVGYAFWTFKGDGLPQPASNPAEIDIFETLVPRLQQAPNALSTCIHTCYEKTNPDCKKPRAQHYYLSNFSYEDWHTYSVEWDVDKITWYVDGKPIRTSANRNLDNFGNSIVDPVKIILSAHANPDYLPPNPPPFEEYMYVDYVKVYQLKCSNTVVINEIPNFDRYCYTVKKSISLSGATTIPQGSNISLRATDFIELKSGFEVPLGAELYLDINPCSGPIVVCPGGNLP